MEPQPAIGPGREIGPFRILRALGRGGMGVVPVVWEGLRPVRAGPPAGHRCR